MQFLITAYDIPNGLERRLAVRQEHFENMNKVKEKGKVVSAGGILDEEGKMKGSFLILEFASREMVDEYIANEPYVKHGVWESVKVEVCNVVTLNNELVGK